MPNLVNFMKRQYPVQFNFGHLNSGLVGSNRMLFSSLERKKHKEKVLPYTEKSRAVDSLG